MAGEAIDQAVVVPQILRGLGPAAPGDVGRRRAYHQRNRAELSRNEPRLELLGKANADIDSFAYVVDAAVCHHQFDRDIRISCCKGWHQGRNDMAAESHGRGDLQSTAGFLVENRHGGRRLLELAYHFAHAVVIKPSGFGQPRLSGGADEKANSERALEPGDVLACSSRRDPEPAGGCSDAAFLHAPHEAFYAPQAIH